MAEIDLLPIWHVVYWVGNTIFRSVAGTSYCYDGTYRYNTSSSGRVLMVRVGAEETVRS